MVSRRAILSRWESCPPLFVFSFLDHFFLWDSLPGCANIIPIEFLVSAVYSTTLTEDLSTQHINPSDQVQFKNVSVRHGFNPHILMIYTIRTEISRSFRSTYSKSWEIFENMRKFPFFQNIYFSLNLKSLILGVIKTVQRNECVAPKALCIG